MFSVSTVGLFQLDSLKQTAGHNVKSTVLSLHDMLILPPFLWQVLFLMLLQHPLISTDIASGSLDALCYLVHCWLCYPMVLEILWSLFHHSSSNCHLCLLFDHFNQCWYVHWTTCEVSFIYHVIYCFNYKISIFFEIW